MIKFAVIAVAVLFYAGYNFYSTWLTRATSIGLTSEQTVQLMFAAIHNNDDMILSNISKGKKMEDVDFGVTAFYVQNTQREAQNSDARTISPSQWLFFTEGTTYWQYGLTNFKIDGRTASTELNYPTRGNHPEPVIIEGGKALTTGRKSTHEVEYNFIYYTGPIINIIHEKAVVTLTYSDKRWYITDISPIKKDVLKPVKLDSYKKDYSSFLNATGKDVKKAASLLRTKYNWVPNDSELSAGAAVMVKNYNNSAAKRYLEQRK